MRRSTKPFTVEVKKRGGRRRDAGDVVPERMSVTIPSFGETVGRDSRFRDAESLFRTAPPVETGFAEPETAPLAGLAPVTPDLASRRILPDLIAEAALSEATLAAAPEPRRRGRPPKDRSGDAPQPVRARKPLEPELEVADADPEMDEVASSPAILYLAASARRRARRATDNLPRAERWKRRLPKVCW